MEIEVNSFLTMAKNRVLVYEWLIGIFTYLPDQKYWEAVCNKDFMDSMVAFRNVDSEKITKGINLVLDFIKKNQGKADESLFEKLSVDRTKLIRVPFNNSFKLPYESQYCEKSKISNLLLSLKTIYGKIGYVPKNIHEALDFLCVELDFLKLLSLEMIKKPNDIGKLVENSNDFLKNHLGSWLFKYTEIAADEAETSFFKGWLLFLEGFVDLEKDYLCSLC